MWTRCHVESFGHVRNTWGFVRILGIEHGAATRAGALDPEGRERLLRYVLRPPVAYERIEHRPEGLVRIALKRAFGDGTLAVEMDPLSLLCRLATSTLRDRALRRRDLSHGLDALVVLRKARSLANSVGQLAVDPNE